MSETGDYRKAKDITHHPCNRCGRSVLWIEIYGRMQPCRHYALNTKKWCRAKQIPVTQTKQEKSDVVKE